ncbi:uncharacterized protein F54H12.2-like [Nasonia vitripennis]|uniref:Uncharacterized protein n=1 Tax=Nasonia vitripennis TaxID=7425 RepID=A0A7M7QMK7_NASVI|nr:uncharacterized protein F54H12.2-like [Nasonia vitripennis]
MAFLHSNSCECIKSELDLFTLPPTQTSVENSQFIHYKPVSSLTDDGPLKFVVPGGSDYLDLAHTMLSIRLQILPNVEIAANESTREYSKVAPVNNLLHSLFNQIDVFFNQKLVSPPNNAYPYRAYIETLLNYSAPTMNSHLTSALWYLDTPGNMETPPNIPVTDPTANKGNVYRQYFSINGQTVDLIGHLHCDVFNQNKFLLNGVELRLRLVRSKDAFCLMHASDNDKFNVHIKEASLIVRRVKVSPGIMLAHANTLAKATAKYPINRVEVKAFTLHSGVHGDTLDNVILDQIPKRIIIGFVDNRAFNGNRKFNPFNFQHFNINYLSLYVDGVQIPSKPLQPRFTGSKPIFVECYHTLFSGTEIHFLNESLTVTRTDYNKDYCFFAFDLTPDLSANLAFHWNLIKHGSVRVEVKFEHALAATINCIIYAEYDNVLEIDSSRQIITDFNA